MEHNNYRSAIMLWVLSICLVVGQNIVFAKSSTSELALEVTITVETNKILIGEPLWVTLTLRNKTDEPIDAVYFGLLKDSILISNDGKTYVPYYGDAEVYRIVGSPLQPGQNKIVKRLILYSHDRLFSASDDVKHLAFPKPGKYYLKAKYKSKTHAIVSNPVEVLVEEPEGDDAVAWVNLNKELYAFFIQNSLLSDEKKELPLLREFVLSYPDSAYARFLASALVKYLSERIEVTAERKEEIERLKSRYGMR